MLCSLVCLYLRVVLANGLGVFTSNADGSLVLATHPVIASEFGDLADSSWLFISFMLAGAASQTVVSSRIDCMGIAKVVVRKTQRHFWSKGHLDVLLWTLCSWMVSLIDAN